MNSQASASTSAVEHPGPEPLQRPPETVLLKKKNICGISSQRDTIIQANQTNVNISYNDYDLLHQQEKAISFCSIDDSSTPYFSGRKEILQQIHSTFLSLYKKNSKKSTWQERVVLLYGLGGMGKSEIARKYAETHEGDGAIQNVVFFNVKSKSNLVESFQEFAENELDLEIKEGEWVPTKVYKHLADRKVQSLFIFDDAEQMNSDASPFARNTKKTGLRDFLPTKLVRDKQFLPWIIITSRNNEWLIPGATKIYIGELSRTEAMEFVTQPLKEFVGRKLTETENIALTNLVILLQGFPLALSLAVTRILENTRLPNLTDKIEAYICGINEPNGNWMDYAHSRHQTTMYNFTMRDIWEKTMSNLEAAENGGDAVKLLDLMIYLRSAHITVRTREDIFRILSTLEEGSINVGLVVLDQNAIVLLERIENPGYNNEMDTWIRIHRLVRRCRRDELDRINNLN